MFKTIASIRRFILSTFVFDLIPFMISVTCSGVTFFVRKYERMDIFFIPNRRLLAVGGAGAFGIFGPLLAFGIFGPLLAFGTFGPLLAFGTFGPLLAFGTF